MPLNMLINGIAVPIFTYLIVRITGPRCKP
uniref:Uncharacterized protein n=1 Tax=Anguilla anguilla TaxID=7936 RepID=A0A0E9SCA9_ANGAN